MATEFDWSSTIGNRYTTWDARARAGYLHLDGGAGRCDKTERVNDWINVDLIDDRVVGIETIGAPISQIVLEEVLEWLLRMGTDDAR